MCPVEKNLWSVSIWQKLNDEKQETYFSVLVKSDTTPPSPPPQSHSPTHMIYGLQSKSHDTIAPKAALWEWVMKRGSQTSVPAELSSPELNWETT